VRIAKAISAVQTVFALQDIEQLRGHKVAEVSQSVLQLGSINGARFIGVEAVEGTLPTLVRYDY
jgi:hypothetical protein